MSPEPACASLPEGKGLLRASRPDHGLPCEGRRPRGALRRERRCDAAGLKRSSKWPTVLSFSHLYRRLGREAPGCLDISAV
eukprot:2094247-Alexandrium_andersonii.AAC.1